MIGLPKVFLACQPIDLRAGFDGLAAKVQQITKPIALTDLTTASLIWPITPHPDPPQ